MYNLRWVVATDEDYYPEVETFTDYMTAFDRFQELVNQNETNDYSRDSNRDATAEVHFGVIFMSIPFGSRRVTPADW